MKRLLPVLLFLLLCNGPAKAQSPTPQDCMGAIPLCGHYYDEPDPYAYSGEGNYPDEIAQVSDCYTDESNGLWYVFNVKASGKLRFTITPHRDEDDYDWIVFDMTHGACSELAENPEEYVVSSNNYGAENHNGKTGANSEFSGGDAGHCNGPGEDNGPPWNDDIPVYAAHTYVLYLSNWSGSEFGYSIDFSESTAAMIDDEMPRLAEIEAPRIAGSKSLTVRFSERVKCGSVNKADFQLTYQEDTLALQSISSTACANGAESGRIFRLTLQEPLQPGTYRLANSSNILDACGNGTVANSRSFQVQGIQINRLRTSDPRCYGESSGKIAIEATYADTTLQYSIDSGATYQEMPAFSGLAAGTYPLFVKNALGYSRQLEAVQLQNPPKINFSVKSKDGGECPGDHPGMIQIHAEGGTHSLQYSIDNGNTFADDSMFSIHETGTYAVRVQDASGCTTDAEQVQLVVPEPFRIETTTRPVTCPGKQDGALQIQAEGGTSPYTYLLNDTGIYHEPEITNLPAGTYALRLKDFRDCLSGEKITELSQPAPIKFSEVEVTDADHYSTRSGAIEVRATGGTGSIQYSLNGSDYQQSGNFTGLTPGTYQLTARDTNNCQASDTLFLEIGKISAIEVPDVFTPNGDGINDRWRIENLDQYGNFHLQVFDKNGRLVYETRSQDIDWQGANATGVVRSDSYFYVIELSGNTRITGSITILK